MSKVFIGGSRRIGRLNDELRERLRQIVRNELSVLVGDANGADKAVQAFFKECQYPDVLVFCTGGKCRNNLGQWTVVTVKPPHRTRDFEYFTAKDVAMARDANFGLMVWDGSSAGTLVNVARMIAAEKPVVLYISPERRFKTLKSREDLEDLLNSCPSDVRLHLVEYIAQHAPAFGEQTILGAN